MTMYFVPSSAAGLVLSCCSATLRAFRADTDHRPHHHSGRRRALTLTALHDRINNPDHRDIMTIRLPVVPAGSPTDFFRQLIRDLAGAALLTGPISQPGDNIRPIRNWIVHHG
ncbi:hypothetical protein LO762_32080 [Actinocorallia sp. API 0066]|uniref:hypothetical protein n=1 Tax=Actinocorallia sp. API 0066 TaxID=2896846 RepID=UPI001E4C86C1|nr:hypothetical protein [Actinocorallia sp. API 0066]MCD0453789.1 hypothetical protein [Actinocorallia sp. API 0066]